MCYVIGTNEKNFISIVHKPLYDEIHCDLSFDDVIKDPYKNKHSAEEDLKLLEERINETRCLSLESKELSTIDISNLRIFKVVAHEI